MRALGKFISNSVEILWYSACAMFACVVIGFLARVAWTFIRGGWGLIP